MGEEEKAVEEDQPGRGRRKAVAWPVLTGVLAFALFGTAVGVVISDNNDAGTNQAAPKTQVLGTQFVRETTTTTTGRAPLDGGKVTVRIDRAPTTTTPTTRPARTSSDSSGSSSSSGTTTVTTARRAAVTADAAPSSPPVTTPRPATTSGTLPPRLECGTGSAHAEVNVDVTPIRADGTWTVHGTIVVSNGVTKPIDLDALTVQVTRDLAAPQEVPVAGAAGTVINAGEVKTFTVDIQSDAQPTAVHIGRLAYHVAGVPACAVG